MSSKQLFHFHIDDYCTKQLVTNRDHTSEAENSDHHF